jgi:hypothetical protein
MTDDRHAVIVDQWLVKSPALRNRAFLALFQRTLDGLWRRARTTLGEVTLIAISERVLYDATERFPALSAVKVATDGIRCDGAREQLEALPRDELRAAARAVLAGWLRVLGNLTGDVLTPALHEELGRVAPATDDPEKDPSP